MFIYLNKADGIGGFEGNERPILGSRRSRRVFSGALKREFPVESQRRPADGSTRCRVGLCARKAEHHALWRGAPEGTLVTLYDHTRPERQRRHPDVFLARRRFKSEKFEGPE